MYICTYDPVQTKGSKILVKPNIPANYLIRTVRASRSPRTLKPYNNYVSPRRAGWHERPGKQNIISP